MTRITGIVVGVLISFLAQAQGGDQQLRAKADGLFDGKNYIDALPVYSQLVSLTPSDRVLNYRFGACLLFGGTDKEKAIGHLKYAVQDPSIPADAWYWLGRAYHLSYLFKEAQAAYQRYQGTGTKKELEGFTVASLDKQCRNGQQLLSNLKEITVRSKVEVDDTEFFRFYELGDIGGKIVVLPEELKSSLDKKSKERTLIYLPTKGGTIYFGSYGKDGKTGRDIYRTELMPDGKFAQPIKLAGYINTDQDEDFAFLHPDGKNFYFSSKGHNSMGGYDVFRSTYDKGLDTFGPPENLDFAVNTPDDDLFYMVDPDNKEACFASGRDSKQGKLHVYRVGTTQMPVILTVLKGTYASVFDKDDRKAHIIVEDVVTHERVSDVRTDINGSYVLALPRSGQFRFLVECGPSGKTHLGTVDIPRSTSPRAFRQELELTRQGDLEKLVIHNYFDTPLDEDMIALMMEEIKRRAKLDVTASEAPIVSAKDVPVENVMKADPLTQAGFAGDVTEAEAVRLAKEDAAELDRVSYDLDTQSKAAFGLAIEAVAEAERTAREAETLVKAAEQGTDEASKNSKMVEAATLRQRSRAANLRARAAYRTGQELEADQLATRQRAAKAGKLAMDLENAITANKETETIAQLKTLKERLDTKAGPDGELTAAESARRKLGEQEKEAARSLNAANAKRAEENEFVGRIDRAKRERDEARNKTRKDELTREITQYDQQLAYLHEEVEGAFTKAREQERQTAIYRGQASLTKHLTGSGGHTVGSELDKEQVSGLGQRIAGLDTRIADLAIDQRYDAQIAASGTELEERMFNWELASSANGAATTERVATAAIPRDASQDARTADGRTITAPKSDVQQGEVRSAAVADVPVGRNAEELASAGSAVGDPATPADAGIGSTVSRDAGSTTQRDSASMITTDGRSTSAPIAGRTDQQSTVTVNTQGEQGREAQGTDEPDNSRTGSSDTDGVHTNAGSAQQMGADPIPAMAVGSATIGTDRASDQVAEGTARQKTTDNTQTEADGAIAVQVDVDPSTSSSEAGIAAGTVRAVDQAAIGTGTQRSTDNTRTDANDATAGVITPEMEAFVLENQRAELQQSLSAERNKTKRDSLQAQLSRTDARIATNKSSMADQQAADELAAEEIALDGVDMDRIPATFYPDTKEADIVTMVYADFTADKQRLEALEDPAARAEGLNGLELMLADSLRGELVRQAAILELAPQQGEQVLPKMERLRLMRQDHLQQADRILQEHGTTLAERTQVSAPVGPAVVQRTVTRYPVGQDPVADRFISLEADPERIYASKIEHRSAKVTDAVALKDVDIERMESLTERIDSLESSLVGLPRKEYEKVQRSADKLTDERMIMRADLGQRTAFLMKEEWRTANDSVKTIEKRMTTLGLSPDENLLLMAQGMQTDAKAKYGQAESLRKQADRKEDIVQRDSLYRSAYAMELEALREMDKAITVKTYLVGGEFQRGETLAYEEVARRVLQITGPTIDPGTVVSDAMADARSLETEKANGSKDPEVGAPQEALTSRAANEAIKGEGDRTTGATDARAAEQNGSADPLRPASELGSRTAEEDGRVVDPKISGVAVEAITDRTGNEERGLGEDGGSSLSEADMERARQQATELADRTVAAMPASASRPVDRYENFMKGENVVLQQEALDPGMDPQLLAIKAERAGQGSAALEQRSLELADRATAIEDSAATARKRDKEELLALAVRLRTESDSLHNGSLAMAEEARALELQKRDAEQAKVLRDRLVKYYYLTGEEQSMVVEDTDQSRYFQAKARALEQYDAASEADAAARINRELGAVLQQEAGTVKRDVVAGRMTVAEAQVRNEVLLSRSELLNARADSLSNIAARLRGAAGINEGQAAVMLQALPADRSTEWMALEMRTRRTEALLAETRDQAGRQGQQPLAAGNTIATTSPINGGADASAQGSRAATRPAESAANGAGAVQAQRSDASDQYIGTTTSERPELAAAEPGRVIAAPFGTDPRISAPAVRRPIAEVAPLPMGSGFVVPEALVTDLFELRPAGDRSATVIPMDARMPEGVVFKVQIGAFRSAIREEVFSDMTPVMGESTGNGLIRYTAGLFMGFEQAAQAKDKVRDRGYRDAFVVAYRDGKRIPLGEAMREARAASALAVTTGTTVNTGGAMNTGATTTAAQQTRTNEDNTVLGPVRTLPTTTEPRAAVIQAPITAFPITAAPETAEVVLAKYPATAEAIVEAFTPAPEAADYYNVPGAAPARQVETVRGLFYTVQVGVYSKPVPLAKLFNISPLNSERTETAKIRYTTGMFLDTEQARIRKDGTVSLGVKDAFVTAYLNGKRISMREAALLLEKFGPAILAKP